jgi:prephenate dehydrogenase
LRDEREQTLVVIGVGLIGGSAALALKSAGTVREVIGVGRNRSNLDDALRLGILDRAYAQHEPWQRELGNADLVLIATPVAQCAPLFAAIARHTRDDCVISDAGSTKQDVVAAARASLGTRLPRFVPAHPIAGSDRSGAASADASLFAGKRVIVTPLPETAADALTRAEALWRACGARVSRLDPARHDALLAAVSHVPHVAAFALVNALAARADASEAFEIAGQGFRDATRIAASSPEMWRDILLANRDFLLHEIDALKVELDRARSLIAQDEASALMAWIARAAESRRALDRVQDNGA